MNEAWNDRARRCWLDLINSISIGLMLGITSCVTAGEIDRRMQAWVGRDADELATAWGAPSGSYTLKDGGKILSYEHYTIVSTGASLYPNTESRSCRIDIAVDAQNRIQKASWRGRADQCAQLLPE